jgi:cysteine-rich repeat protein
VKARRRKEIMQRGGLPSAIVLAACIAGPGCAIDGAFLDVSCGNGLIDSGEACDDGNTTPGDGCDEACRLEAPGDADVLEDADADADAADAGIATCADESTIRGLCAGRTMCFVVTFAIGDNPDVVEGRTNTDAFDALEGLPAVYVVAGDYLSLDYSAGEAGGEVVFRGANAAFGLAVPSLVACERIGWSLRGTAVDFRGVWTYGPSGGTSWLADLPLRGTAVGETWSVAWRAEGMAPLPWESPTSELVYRPFTLPGTVTLERLDLEGPTDRATGSATLQSL